MSTGTDKRKKAFTLLWSLSLVVLSTASMSFVPSFVNNYPIVENIIALGGTMITFLVSVIIFLLWTLYVIFFKEPF